MRNHKINIKHLTHGAKPTFSGKNYNSVQYEVDENTMEIDYERLGSQIEFYKPRLFIAGASAYPRKIDFQKISEIIQSINSNIYDFCKLNDKCYEDEKIIFMADMAHIAGLVAAGLHQNPLDYADVVTTTTHKTLRQKI